MICSLFAGVVEWLRGCGSALSAPDGKRRCEPFARPPRLEALEDRFLPSATTVIPNPADIPQRIAVTDFLFAVEPKGNPSVAFVGDSINWEYAYGSGASVWAAYLAPAGMASYGVIGQTTQSLLYQFSLGLLNGINPSVVVLNIGGNNLLQGDTPQATAAGIVADVNMIHQYLPQTEVLVLGVLPGMQNASDPYRIEGAQTDQLAAQMLAGDPRALFVNLGSVFVQANGTIPTSLMSDFLHPTQLGYLELTSALLPVIQQILIPTSSSSSFSSPIPVITLPSLPATPPSSSVSIMP